MEKFYFEIPTIERKEDAHNFIQEFHDYHSGVFGSGGLDRYFDDYEGWLQKLEADYIREPNEDKVPARTYFFIRESDKKIIGMINVRLALNEKLRNYGGNIGYCIRPTERGKGYNKINLYLGLKVCKKYGVNEVLLDADIDNPASWKTMEALGGIRIKDIEDDSFSHCHVVFYVIDVKNALLKHLDYEQYIDSDNYIK